MIRNGSEIYPFSDLQVALQNPYLKSGHIIYLRAGVRKLTHRHRDRCQRHHHPAISRRGRLDLFLLAQRVEAPYDQRG